MNKKLLALLLAATTVFAAMSGCTSGGGGSAETTGAGSRKDTLIMSNSEDIGILNPHTYDGRMYAQDWVYEGLTAFKDNKVIPALAESWDVSEDGKVYTFHLRKGVVYTDGSPFNAENAKKNFDAVLKHKADHSWLESLQEITDVKAVDKNTLELTLKNAYYPFLQELSLIRPIRFCADVSFPASGDTYTNGITEPIGTGMWKLKEHKEGEYAVFERNDAYWGDKPSFKYLKVEVIGDATTAVSALKTGEIDMIYDIGNVLTADSFNELKSVGFLTYVSESQSTLALALNTKTGFTNELTVRQALEYAVDKNTICKTVYGNLRTPSDTLFSSKLPYCGEKLNTSYTYDPDKAAALLEEAGWTLSGGSQYRIKHGQTLSLKYCYISTDTVSKSLGEVLQSMYAKIGVEVQLVGEESNSFNKRQQSGDFDIIVSETWGNQYDPHSMVASYREPAHADYRAQEGLSNKAYLDDLITKLLVETDETRLQEMYTEIFNILQNNAVYIPVCSSTILCVTAKDISGVEFNASNFIPTQSLVRTAS